MIKKGKIFILSGPSGSGKTTLYRRLLKENRTFAKSISVTTRNKRQGEVHKRDYVFVSQKMFDFKKRAGHFLEWEKVFENFYGTPKKHVLDLLKQGRNVLLCIDVKGARTVRKKIRGAITIFVKTPTLKDLEIRLKARASEGPDVIRIRLETAKTELLEADQYHHIIVNDDIETAYQDLKNIIEKELSARDSGNTANP